MKKNYIQPQTEVEKMQNLQVICSSPEGEINGGNESADPNVVEIF